MRRALSICALLLILPLLVRAQVVHVFPATDTINNWSALNNFNAGLTTTTATISGLTSGRCIQTTTGGQLVVAPAACNPVTGATLNGGLVLSSTTLGLRTDCSSGNLIGWNGTSWGCSSGNLYAFQVNGSTLTAGDTVNLNNSTPAAPSNGYNVTFSKSTVSTTDSVSAAVVGDGNAAHALLGTGTFGTPYTLPSQYAKLHCQPGLGDGQNAIAAATYTMLECVNDSGVTWTITGVHCYTDNAGTSTLNAANNAGTGLLTGAITCNNTKANGGAAGVQSGTTTLASGDAINFTFVSDGTSKTTTWTVGLTQ